MEDIQFKYAFGGIDEILSGETERVDSLDEIKNSSSRDSRRIIVPKILGVYQEKKTDNPKMEKEFERRNEISKRYLFAMFQKKETVHPDLICIAYEYSDIGDYFEGILRNSLSGDTLNRLKITRSLDLPLFDEKQDTENEFCALFFKIGVLEKISDINASLLDRAKDILRMQRRDYGLNLREAIILNSTEDRLISEGKSPRIYMPSERDTELYGKDQEELDSDKDMENPYRDSFKDLFGF